MTDDTSNTETAEATEAAEESKYKSGSVTLRRETQDKWDRIISITKWSKSTIAEELAKMWLERHGHMTSGQYFANPQAHQLKLSQDDQTPTTD